LTADEGGTPGVVADVTTAQAWRGKVAVFGTDIHRKRALVSLHLKQRAWRRRLAAEHTDMPTTTSRDLVIRTLNHQPVDRAPRDLWASPAVETTRSEELAEVNVRYPSDIIRPDFKYPAGKRSLAKPAREGQHTDAWGCTWQASPQGTAAEAKNPPLVEAAKIAAFRPPLEVLDAARFARVNRSCETTSRFVLAQSEIQPFQRLQCLRGKEAALADLAGGGQEIRHLLAMLHEFFCREAEIWAGTDVDGVALRDDWGSADSLLIAPETWRDLFRPLYREYCKILHGKDKFVFFQSSGNIADIFGELVRIGIDALHAEWFPMTIERLARRHRGRITFWGGIDRHDVLAHGTPEEVREAVHRVRKALDFGSGGVIAQCPWDPDVPLRRIALVFEQWMLPLPMHA
jgi:hypothetical protein